MKYLIFVIVIFIFLWSSYWAIVQGSSREWTPQHKTMLYIESCEYNIIHVGGKSNYSYSQYTILSTTGQVYNVHSDNIYKITVNDNDVPHMDKVWYIAKNSLIHKIFGFSTKLYTYKRDMGFGGDIIEYRIVLTRNLYDEMFKK